MQHDKTAHAAKGKWRGILGHYGIPEKHLNGKSYPCPLCGGKDRAPAAKAPPARAQHLAGRTPGDLSNQWYGRRDSNPHWDTQADFKSAASTIPPGGR